MSIEKSLQQKKDRAHLESWKDEIENSIGKSSKELGIYNRQEVEDRLSNLYKKIPQMKDFAFISELEEINEEAGVYAVGGLVRDAVTEDIDFENLDADVDLVVTGIEPVSLVKALQKHGKVTFDRNPNADLSKMPEDEINSLVGNNNGALKFNPHDSDLKELIDVILPREDDHSESGQTGISGIKKDVQTKVNPNLNIIRDLERRSLTMNAMAVNLINGEIIDPFEGIEDIVKRKIRAVGNPKERILKEDLSRGFRALRFAARFNAEIEEPTEKAIREIFRPADFDSVKLKTEQINALLQEIDEMEPDDEEIKKICLSFFNLDKVSDAMMYRDALSKINELVLNFKKNQGRGGGPEVYKEIKKIGEISKIKKEKKLPIEYYKRKSDELNLLFEEIEKNKDLGAQDKELIKDASQQLDFSLSGKAKFQFYLLKKQLEEKERKTRQEFSVPEDQNFPRFLTIYCDREQGGKPRLAVSKEVMGKEILKSIKANPKKFIDLLDKVNGLKFIFPEIERLKNLAQPQRHHGEGDAYKHTLMVIDNLPADSSLELKLAALLHDTGKYDTKGTSEKGEITFRGHDKISAEHTEKIFEKFVWRNIDSKLKEKVHFLVANHMLPLSRDAVLMKNAKIYGKFLKNEDLGKDLITLSQADAMASIPAEGEPNIDNINQLIGKIEAARKNLAIQQKSENIPKLVTGHDLINLGLEPGSKFTEILDMVREAQLDGRIGNKEQALELMKKSAI